MNTTLPAPRDLPPHRHARIRAELERAVTHRRRWAWLAPALTGAAVVILVAIFAWPSPPSSPVPTDLAPGQQPTLALPGVSPARRTEIASQCRKVTGLADAQVYQRISDADGDAFLLYTPDGSIAVCRERGDVYERGVAGGVGPLDWLPGAVSVDTEQGYLDGGHPYRGQVIAGRLTSKVARVTFTDGGVTRDAAIANGTYLLRILHPIGQGGGSGVVRAYDAHGALLATVDPVDDRPFDETCYRLTGGKIVPKNAANRHDCRVGVRWR
jgi:hypothetical protein